MSADFTLMLVRLAKWWPDLLLSYKEELQSLGDW